MPYKREHSPYYYVRRRSLPGYGDTGRLSTKTTSKKTAGDMERLLDDLAEKAILDPTWYELLDALCKTHKLALPEVLRAKNTGNLAPLKRNLNDPPLKEAADIFLNSGERKREIKIGLAQFLENAQDQLGENVRLSAVCSGRVLTSLYERAQADGRKRNSVRRYMMRAASHLLRYHLGTAERNRIFVDVQFAAEDDTREVHLSAAEIGRLLEACQKFGYDEAAIIIRMALQTSADRGVLLAGSHAGKERRGLRVRDLAVYRDDETGRFSGEVYLRDSKTDHRSRTVPLTDSLCRELVALCKGKDADDTVFSTTYDQIDFVWKRVRKAAGLDHVRFKDLRAQVSIYGEEAGVPLTVLSRTYGHDDEKMTRRYQQRKAVMQTEQAEAIEAAMLKTARNGRKQVAKPSTHSSTHCLDEPEGHSA